MQFVVAFLLTICNKFVFIQQIHYHYIVKCQRLGADFRHFGYSYVQDKKNSYSR